MPRNSLRHETSVPHQPQMAMKINLESLIADAIKTAGYKYIKESLITFYVSFYIAVLYTCRFLCRARQFPATNQSFR